ncbi:sigma-54 dependent transcriptional regulator [Acidipila sp. 4G-K13]|uniref:Sigma-54-dependent Fis family transcriptional regulator n=2 Tax=Paracidobacterium acidisoli TaxID=2303751 RepID=A0A372ISP7_9BACT|nr:sigma-54 dependent transcriptional regulator [Paracidobacterium acidisoli]
MLNPVQPTPSAAAGRLHVLVIDRDPAIRNACCEIAAACGCVPHGSDSLTAARALLTGRGADIVLIDQKAAMSAGFEVLDEMKALQPVMAVVLMTAASTVSAAVEAIRSGASDYLIKPFAVEEVTAILERLAKHRHMDRASRTLREKLRTQQGMGNIIGQSPEMEKLYRILSKVAQSTHPVLILGESGTGKELVAHAIHAHGPGAGRPFVPVDCGSLVPSLIESELFGHVKGAFTGAERTKDGLLVSAEGGTVFLDEIGELPLDLQAKLLRALQEKEVRPVGGSQRIPIRARILTATHRDLAGMVEQGRFRRDLYYRLNVVKLQLPALRDRKEDIPLLAAYFLERNSREYRRDFRLSADTLSFISEYHWPGNVRELANAIDRACNTASDEVIEIGEMTTSIRDSYLHRLQTLRPRADAPVQELAVMPLAEMERQAILTTLNQVRGDKLLAARLLGIGKTTLYRKLKEYGLGPA